MEQNKDLEKKIIEKIIKISTYTDLQNLKISELGKKGRISLLIGRIDELKQFSTSEYHFATPILSLLIIICLAIWSYSSKKETQEELI